MVSFNGRLPVYTAAEIGKVLGVVDDGSGNPVLDWVDGGAAAYTPSLNFSDGRNSQYCLLLLGW